MEERSRIWKGVSNILNKQSRIADNVWSSSLGVGRGAINSSAYKRSLLRNIHTEKFGRGLILWNELGNEKGQKVWCREC
jgi:hypothetical protein